MTAASRKGYVNVIYMCPAGAAPRAAEIRLRAALGGGAARSGRARARRHGFGVAAAPPAQADG